MGIIIFAGTYGGYRLDKVLSFRFPVATLVLSLISVFAAIYIFIKEVTSE